MKTAATVLLRRLPHIAIVLLIVTASLSVMVALIPGDPAVIAAGDVADPAYVEFLREELGLNDSVVSRYVGFLTDLAGGDLGTSASMNRGVPVATLIQRSLSVTMSLVLLSLVGAIALALPIGYLAARRPGTWLDRLVTMGSASLLAIPPFVLGVIAVKLFAVDRPWFPSVGYAPLAAGPGEWLRHLILPAFALGAVSAAELSRQVRGAFVDAFDQDYVHTAEAKGLRRRTVVWKHAFKNAATPMLIVAGLQVPRNLGGAVVVERVFALPGFGLLAVHSVEARDIPVMQGVVLVSSIIVLATNLLVDAGTTRLNPMSRHV